MCALETNEYSLCAFKFDSILYTMCVCFVHGELVLLSTIYTAIAALLYICMSIRSNKHFEIIMYNCTIKFEGASFVYGTHK